MIDRAILVLLATMVMSPGIIWAVVSFGWMPLIFILIEIVILRYTVYKMMTGTILE